MDTDMDTGMDTSMDTDADTVVPYPETIIVVITAHGEIKVETTFDGRQEPDIFAIPYGMTLTKINAVAPGVCNYLSPKRAKIIVNRVKEMTTIFDIRQGVPSNLVTLFSNEFKRLLHIDRPSLSKKEYDGENMSSEKKFDIHYDKAFKNITYAGYDFTINKGYGIKELSKNYDDRIIFLNTPQGDVDFFSSLTPPYDTDLETIVYYLKDQGVKNILLIDLSCATFDNTDLSSREERSLRRETFRERWGGYKKHKSNKHKSNKHKSKKQNKRKNRRTRRYKKLH